MGGPADSLLLLLLLLLSVVVVAATDVIRIPVEQHAEPLTHSLIRQGIPATHLLAFRTNHSAIFNVLAKQDNGELYDYRDLLYVGKVFVGTPAQTFRVVLDTGSADFWLMDRACFSSGCADKAHYDQLNSSTYRRANRRFSIKYGTGDAQGEVGFEAVRLAAEAQSPIRDANFGQATQVADFFRGQELEGILGLGFQRISLIGAPVFQLAVEQRLVQAPVFTFWMRGRGYDARGTSGGQITYGGLDPDHCSAQVDYVRISRAAYWQFTVTRVSIGDEVVNGRYETISDTGTSLMILSTRVFKAVVKATGAKYDAYLGWYKLPCDKKFRFEFEVDGLSFHLNAADLLLEPEAGTCVLLAQAADADVMIFGQPLIRQYCQVHDVGAQRLGFARSLTAKPAHAVAPPGRLSLLLLALGACAARLR